MKVSPLRIIPSLFVFLLAVVATQWAVTQPLSAQDDGQAQEQAAAENGDGEGAAAGETRNQTLIDLFQAGGWAMYPLTLLSVAGFGLIIYNFLAIKPGPFLMPETTRDLDEKLSNLQVDEAKRVCDENPSPVTNIVGAGLERANMDDFSEGPVKEAVEDASSEELAGPYVLINYLSVIGSIAPMVGLLGTVSGMVKAFNAIAAEGTGDPKRLADNISEALITTASGLIIGIPAMFFFYFFKNKYGKITSRVSRIVGDLVYTLSSTVKQRGA